MRLEKHKGYAHFYFSLTKEKQFDLLFYVDFATTYQGIRRTASVVAKEDCMVLKLDKDTFLNYLGDYFERVHR